MSILKYLRNNQFYKIILDKLIKSFVFVSRKKKFLFLNKIVDILRSLKADLIYVVEGRNWVIYWEGKYITENLKKLKLMNAEITTENLANNQIIHFGSINCLIKNNQLIKLKKSNKIIVTWYHIDPKDKRIKLIPILNKYIDIMHTSNQITKNQLLEYGLDEKRIVVIPIGVDLSHFKILSEEKRKAIKRKFNLPENKIIIGSFQKDGVGWGDGLKPKYVKGPDIFCEVVKNLNEKYNIHVFLTGPSRGFVKKKLSDYNIPFTHIYLKNYPDVMECYNVLDLYIVTSRTEGGPKALMECMATGVPIISTKVGMAPEIIKNEFNGFIADIDDINQIIVYAEKIMTNDELRNSLIRNGLESVKKYDYIKISKQYYSKIYKHLIK